MSPRKKAADEVFCTSCGEAIKKKAEICPHCGVPNENQQGSPSMTKSTNQSTASINHSSDSTSPHNPSNHETTVSDSWWLGIATSIVFWLIGFALPEGTAIAGFIFVVAWALMPLSIYFDRQWLQATTNWAPNEKFWLIVSVIPLVNIVAGGVYLFRRYEAEQISAPTTRSSNETSNSPEDAAIQELRERYASGELTDEEFEEKVERILETESGDNAETYMELEEE